MAQSVTWNGVTFSVPGAGDLNWYGANGVDGLLVSLAQNALSAAGGTVSLSNDFNFGGTNGLVSVYFKSHSANIAQSGVLRLARTDSLAFRNQANGADLLLSVNSSNQLTFNGVVVDTGLTPTFTSLTLGNGTVGAPALNLGDSATGLYRPSSNVLGVAGNGVDVANFSQQDATTLPIRIQNGLIRVDSNSDTHGTLEYQGTKLSIGNLNSRAYTADNTALINSRSATDGDLFAAFSTSTGNTQDFFKLSTASTTVTGTWNQGGTTVFAMSSSGVTSINSLKIPSISTAGVLKNDASGNVTSLANGSNGQFLKIASGVPAWSTFSPSAPTVQKFLTTGSTTGYLFTVTSANATVGATYTNNSNTYTVLATIASATQLWCSGASAPLSSGTLTKSAGSGDATITFSAATAIGTYTTAANALYIRVRMVGGGSGGTGSSTVVANNGGTGGTGGNTTFGTALLSANGGVGGTTYSGGASAASASLGTGPIGIALSGGVGGCGFYTNLTTAIYGPGGMGSASPLGGGGASGGPSAAGSAPSANTGAGGGGGGAPGANANGIQTGCGGSSGGFIDAIISSPSATYPYSVGAAGTAGTLGTSGSAGGAGAAGIIEVTEFYQ